MPAKTAAVTGTGEELLADLAASWEITLRAELKSAATIRVYCAGVAAFIAWHQGQAPGMPVVCSSLDRRTASAFLADLLASGLSPATARARHAALRQFTIWLAEEGVLDADPLLGLRPPKLDDPRVDGLTDGELAAMIKACRVPAGADRWTAFECVRDEAVIRLLAETGMRAGELLALTLDDIDLHRRIVTIRHAKGGKHRVSGFGPQAARAVDRYLRKGRRGHRLAAGPRLWLGTLNRGWTYAALRRALARRAEAAGVKDFHPHRLRHTSASAWLRDGGSEQGAMAAVRLVEPPDAGQVHTRDGVGAGRRGGAPPVRRPRAVTRGWMTWWRCC